MNISNALLTQLDNFSQHRYAHLNDALKDELAIHFKSLGFGKLNKQCNTCVRIAMDKLNENKHKVRPVIRQQNNEPHMNEQPPKLHFVGIKQRTFADLRREAKERGFKPTRSTTREELETFLNNE